MARTMTPEEYQELGRRYYKLKQYDKAIETLSQGIEASPTVGLYDHRAAAYDKLGDFNNAVKDGREMIKLDKKEIKGYLRTASVLEKMEKPDTALGIYKYGMKNVPLSDKNFKLLQQLHDKLTRKLSPATAIDPFTVLPVELAEMILEYLSFKQMVNCMPVSRGWKDYLSKLPKLWMHLDLSGARRPVPRSFVSKAVKRSQDRVNRVTIHRFEHVDMLKNMAQMCKELRDLDIISLPYKVSASLIQMVQSARQLKKIVVRNEISLETATAILTNGPGLEHVSFYNLMRTTRYAAEWKGPFPNLKTFQVFGMDTFLESYFQTASFLEQAPALSSLELPSLNIIAPSIGLETLSSLTTLILKRTKFLSFPVLPTSLQNLTIEYDGSFNLLSTNIDTGLLRCRLPNLTHLTLHGFDGLCPEKLEELLDLYMDDAGTIHALQPATPLTSLSIHGVLHISPQQAQNTLFHPNPHSLLTRSPRILTTSLQHLDIASLPCTDDDIEQLLGHEVAGLQSIDVSWTNVTGAGIKMLADGIKGLKVIRADQCRRITGRDAILYAERKGIVVSCQMGEGKGGRKVRYG